MIQAVAQTTLKIELLSKGENAQKVGDDDLIHLQHLISLIKMLCDVMQLNVATGNKRGLPLDNATPNITKLSAVTKATCNCSPSKFQSFFRPMNVCHHQSCSKRMNTVQSNQQFQAPYHSLNSNQYGLNCFIQTKYI